MGRGRVRAGLVAYGGPRAYRGEPACRVGRPAKVAQHSETIWYRPGAVRNEMRYKTLNFPPLSLPYTTLHADAQTALYAHIQTQEKD